MDQQPIDLQALLGELISLRRENKETRAQLAQLDGSRAMTPNPATALEPHAPTPEGFTGGAESIKNFLTSVQMFRRLAAKSGYDVYAKATFLREGCREETQGSPHDAGASDQTSRFAPPRPRYEPPAPAYNLSNDVAPIVIDAIRRGKISDAERARRFLEDLCLYCDNAGHHRDQCAELKAKEVKSGRLTVKTNKANVSAYSGPNPKPSPAASSSATSLSLKLDIRIDSIVSARQIRLSTPILPHAIPFLLSHFRQPSLSPSLMASPRRLAM
ncbi:hypothetical protein RI367_008540 [Sorochytrium milnesiophthora]